MSLATTLRYKLAISLLGLALLAACGGSFDDEERQEYIDKCVIGIGPRTDRDTAHEYCLAKWRELQREKAKGNT